MRELERKKFNLSLHNCQGFEDEAVKIFKAVRIHNKNNIGTIEEKSLAKFLNKYPNK